METADEQIRRLQNELVAMTAKYEGACQLVTQMHAAAFGAIGCGPKLDPVDDIYNSRRKSPYLNFHDLRTKNVARLKTMFDKLKSFTPTDWALAVAGEAGKVCGHINERRLGSAVPQLQIAQRLADAVIYADLLASSLEIDLGAAVVEEFDRVSRASNCDILLGVPVASG